MSDVIFCKTRYQDKGYASYNDFWDLVRLAGYPIQYVDEIDPGDASKTYIVTPLNGEWLAGWPGATARIIHYELEWRWDWRADVDEPPGVAEVWASDKWLADKIGAKYVVLGSHPDLNLIVGVTEKTYDVAQISYQVPRRAVITADLQQRGLRLAPCENLWGRARAEALSQSRLMLHVHQHADMPGVAPLRWALAAAFRLPLVTETLRDRGVFGYTYLMQCSYEFLGSFTAQVARDPGYQDYGLALHNLLCRDMTFRECVEGAL